MKRSLQVTLDLLRGTRLGALGVRTGTPPGPALPQQVPALVERFLERFQSRVFLGRIDFSGHAAGAQLVLLIDQAADLVEDVAFVHNLRLTRSPGSRFSAVLS